MKRTEIGTAGLSGWRTRVADGVAEPVARRTPLGDEDVRALVGAAFFVLSLYYVIASVARAVKSARN